MINARSGLLEKKAKEIHVSLHQTAVAPYTGAWIETLEKMGLTDMDYVAPYTGAWIETFQAAA